MLDIKCDLDYRESIKRDVKVYSDKMLKDELKCVENIRKDVVNCLYNNLAINLILKDLRQYESILLEEESNRDDDVLDELYNKIQNYVYTTNFGELKEHYDWYKVQYDDEEDLINRMYESYVNSYTNEELKFKIKDFS